MLDYAFKLLFKLFNIRLLCESRLENFELLRQLVIFPGFIYPFVKHVWRVCVCLSVCCFYNYNGIATVFVGMRIDERVEMLRVEYRHSKHVDIVGRVARWHRMARTHISELTTAGFIK